MIFKVTFHETGEVKEIDLPEDTRAGTDISLSIDGIVAQYHVMTVGGPINNDVAYPSVMRVAKR